MLLSLIALKTERQWRSTTGLSETKFRQLSIYFANSYEQLYGRKIDQCRFVNRKMHPPSTIASQEAFERL